MKLGYGSEVVISYGHHVTKVHDSATNAPIDLLFVPHEAYYNVVLGNQNLKCQVYLAFVTLKLHRKNVK